MKIVLSFLLLLTQFSFAQSLEMKTCYEDLQNMDGQSKVTNFITTGSSVFMIGFMLAGSSLSVIPASIGLGVFLHDEIKDEKIDRLMQLINESEAKIQNPEQISGPLLTKIVKKINKKIEPQITELDFAELIDTANKDRLLCQSDNLIFISQIKNNMREFGSFDGEDRTSLSDKNEIIEKSESSKESKATDSVIEN